MMLAVLAKLKHEHSASGVVVCTFYLAFYSLFAFIDVVSSRDWNVTDIHM